MCVGVTTISDGPELLVAWTEGVLNRSSLSFDLLRPFLVFVPSKGSLLGGEAGVFSVTVTLSSSLLALKRDSKLSVSLAVCSL